MQRSLLAALALWLAACGDAVRRHLPPQPEGGAADVPDEASAPATPEPQRWSALKDKIRRTFPGVDHVSVPAFAAELEAGAAPLLLDVRAANEYRVSHLASAVRAEDLDAALSALADSPRDRPVVVYCSVGYRSSRLAAELEDAGYTNVRNLEGSIFEWANTGRPLESEGAPVRTVHPYDDDWGALLRRELWAAPTER